MTTQSLERVYKVTADASQAINQLDKIAKSAGNIDSRIGKLGSALKGAFAGAVVIGGIAAVGNAFKKAADSMDEMVKSAQKVGVTTETLSRLKYAADQSGVSFDGLQTGLKKLNKNLADVESGTTGAAKALRSLGVKDGDSPEASLGKIAEAFANVPDSAKKTALAMEIFGKSGADLIPMLNAGADGLKELTDRAQRLGLVIDENTAKAAEKFNDSLSDVSAVLGAISKQITAGALPAFSNLAKTLADSLAVSDEWKEVGRVLGEAVLWFTDKFIKATATVYAFGKGIGAVAAAASELASGNFKAAGNILSMWVDDVNALGASTEEISKKLSGMNAASDETTRKFGANAAATKQFSDAANSLKSELTGAQKALVDLQKVGADRIKAIESLKMLESLSPQAIAKLGVTVKDVADAITKLRETADPTDAALRKFSDSVRSAINPANDLTKYLYDLDAALAAGYISWNTYADATLKAMEKMNPEKLKETKDALDEIGVAIGVSISNGVSGLVDAFFQADQSFQQFASNFLQQIGKMILQMMILAGIKKSLGGTGLGSFLGFANGGQFGGSTTLPKNTVLTEPTFFKFANGGTFGGGGSRMGVAGEAGPEAVIPLKRNNAGKLGVGASPVNVTINNSMSESADVKVQETNRADGTREISILIEKRVKELFANGAMDKQMRGAYGLSRNPG
jgi:hypothetical protein